MYRTFSRATALPIVPLCTVVSNATSLWSQYGAAAKDAAVRSLLAPEYSAAVSAQFAPSTRTASVVILTDEDEALRDRVPIRAYRT